MASKKKVRNPNDNVATLDPELSWGAATDADPEIDPGAYIEDPELLAELGLDAESDTATDFVLGQAKPRPESEQSADTSIYQRLVDYNLLRKVTDIVLAKVDMPWHLRKDATQEVHAYWASLKAKSQFQRNQVACYATMTGQHAALKLRRTIGAVVVIPGTIFRNGRNTTFMNAIGAAVNPHDIDDFKDSIELSAELEDTGFPAVSEEIFNARIGNLDLSTKQLRVAYMNLIERKTPLAIARELGTQEMYVERLLNQVTKKISEFDDNKRKAAEGVKRKKQK